MWSTRFQFLTDAAPTRTRLLTLGIYDDLYPALTHHIPLMLTRISKGL